MNMDLYMLKNKFKSMNLCIPRPLRKICIIQICITLCMLFLWIQYKKGLSGLFIDEDVHVDTKLLEFFTEANYNGVNIKYLSSANNRTLVYQFIQGNYDVIEGDVVAFKEDGGATATAVMYERSKVSQRLKFREWLQFVCKRNRAIKVDLKSIDSIEVALQDLQYVYNQNYGMRRIPIILGGNILAGPNWHLSSFPALEPDHFMRHVNSFPYTMLALGWVNAIDLGDPNTAQKYEWTTIKDMYDIAVKLQNKDADLQLTFNVRVDFVAASISRLRWLTEMTGGSISIQLGDDTDPSKAFLSTSDYRIIKSHISSTKVFYEMNIKSKISEETETLKEGEFGMDRWQVVRYHINGELVYLGTESLIMQHAVVISRAADIKAAVNAPIRVTTVVEFIKVFNGKPNYVELCTRANIGSIAESLSGVCVRLDSNGDVLIRSRSIPGVDINVPAHRVSPLAASPPRTTTTTSASTSRALCFHVSLVDTGVEVTTTVGRYKSCDRRSPALVDQWEASVSMKDVSTATGRRIVLAASGENGFIVVEGLDIDYTPYSGDA